MKKRTPSLRYLHQYGYWASATPAQWRTICEKGATGEGYDLGTMAKPLAGRPYSVRSWSDGDGRRCYYDIAGHDVLGILDWTQEEWQDALNALTGS